MEIAAYDTFVNMGATPPAGVLTTGGGSANPRWQAMRKRKLGVPVAQGAERDAALGAAILATYKDEVEEGEASLDAAEQLKMAMEALQARASADGSMDEEEEVEEGGEEGEAGVEDQAEEVEADDSQTETETETVQK